MLTAAHVVPGATAKVTMRDGSVQQGTVLRRRADVDVALVALDRGVATCLPVAMAPPKVGTEVLAIGSPASKELAFTLTRGIVSGTRELDGQRLLQTDASISPGNSGGPLIGEDGRVVAIVSWKLLGKAVEGIAFGVPIDAALSALGLRADASTDLQLLRERPKTDDQKATQKVTDREDADFELDTARARAAKQARLDSQERQREADRSRAIYDATPGWVYWMRYLGYATAAAGGGLTAYSYFTLPPEEPTEDGDFLTRDEYESKRTLNDVGWGLVAVGAASAVTSYFLEADVGDTKRDETKPAAPASPTVKASIGPTGGSITLTF